MIGRLLCRLGVHAQTFAFNRATGRWYWLCARCDRGGVLE